MSSILNLMHTKAPADTKNSKRLIRDSLVEFLATTLFIFAGTLSALATGRRLIGVGAEEDVARVLPIAIAFGVSILFMVYSIGHITGGHMNPGVSLLMALKREMSFTKMTCYWVAQFTASLLASSLVWGCTSGLTANDEVGRPPVLLGATTLDAMITTGNGFLLEFMGSFIFYFVIAQTALDKRGIASSMFPAIPIGLSLVVVHVGLIPFTGCGVNPARTFGPSMITCMGGRCDEVVGSWYWIYYIGPFLASFAVAEVTAWLEVNVDEDDEEHVASGEELEEIDSTLDESQIAKEVAI